MTRLKEYLKPNQAAVIVTDVNRFYFSGFRSSLGFLFVSKDKQVLIVDGRYYLAAKETVKSVEVLLMGDLSKQLKNLSDGCSVTEILLENSITVSELERFKNIFSGLTVTCNGELMKFIGELRAVKNQSEVDCMIKAQRIAEKAYLEVLDFIKVGVSEHDVAAFLEYKMKLLGGEGESFDTVVVSGKNSAKPHGVPCGKPIESGDFVTMDFGATFGGYHSDMTRTVAVGFATDKMQLVYDTVLKANIEVAKSIKSGMLCSEADKIARNVIESKGFGEYFTHSLGHSVGLEVHESPSLSPKSKEILVVGNIVTDEPGIYIENEFGVRIEDMLLVKGNGCENLTMSEKSLIIL